MYGLYIRANHKVTTSTAGKECLYMARLFASVMLISLGIACYAVWVLAITSGIKAAVAAISTMTWMVPFSIGLVGSMLIAAAMVILLITAIITIIHAVQRMLSGR